MEIFIDKFLLLVQSPLNLGHFFCLPLFLSYLWSINFLKIVYSHIFTYFKMMQALHGSLVALVTPMNSKW